MKANSLGNVDVGDYVASLEATWCSLHEFRRRMLEADCVGHKLELLMTDERYWWPIFICNHYNKKVAT